MCCPSQLLAIWAFGERDRTPCKTRGRPVGGCIRASPPRVVPVLMKTDARLSLAQARIRQQIQESRSATVLHFAAIATTMAEGSLGHAELLMLRAVSLAEGRVRRSWRRRSLTSGSRQQPDAAAARHASGTHVAAMWALSAPGARHRRVCDSVKRAAAAFAAMGCDIVTGGGPRLMQAANEARRKPARPGAVVTPFRCAVLICARAARRGVRCQGSSCLRGRRTRRSVRRWR